jgi:hypothetical protein
MYKKQLLIVLLSLLAMMTIPQIAKAATMTACTPDKDTYLQGQTGYIAVTIYNDKNDKIRVTQLSATIDYYYDDGTRYVAKTFTDANLPAEIPKGQSATYNVSFSIPTNFAPGFINPTVEASTDLWINASSRWVSSDYLNSNYLTSKPKLFVESSYKAAYENSEQQYENMKQQYQEQLSLSGYLNNMTDIFIVLTIVFASLAGVLFVFFTRRKPIAQQ